MKKLMTVLAVATAVAVGASGCATVAAHNYLRDAGHVAALENAAAGRGPEVAPGVTAVEWTNWQTFKENWPVYLATIAVDGFTAWAFYEGVIKDDDRGGDTYNSSTTYNYPPPEDTDGAGETGE